MHDSSSSAAAVPATVESSSGHHLHAHSATAATALPGMSTGDSGLSAGQSAGQAGQSGQSLLLPRINSGPCTANPLSLESWVLSTSRHSYVDIQRYAPKQSLLHYPVDKQRVTLSTGASSQSSSCQFLDRLAESDAASGTRMCVLARLCSRPLVGQYGEFVKAAQWQTTFLEWIAENSPSAIRSLQDDVRTMRNNGNATASPAFVLQPRNMPCLSPSPTSSSSSSCVDSGRDGVDPCAVPHIDAGAGAAGACDQCVPPLPPPQQHRSSSTCLRGWVMLPAGHLVQDVHSTLDRLLCAATPSCTPSCDTYSPQHRDREQEFVQPDEMVRCLPVFDPSKNEFVPATPERLSRRQLLRQCTTLRSRLSNSFAKLFLLDETPEMLYLKHRRACTRTSSVSTTPTGGNGNISSMDPPIFSDSVKVGQYYMDPLSTVPVKRLLGMFAEDGSVLCPKTLKPLILPEDVDVDYVTSIGGVKPFSHHSVGDRKVHGVEYCMDANDGLQSDAALQRLRDSLNRVMDPTGSAVELKAALSDESDIIPALTGARRSRITTTESTTSSSSSSSSRSSSTGRAKTSATSSSKQSSGRSHILEASGSRSKKQHLTSKSSSLSSSRSSSVSSLGRSLQSSKAVSSPSLSSSSSLSSRDKQQRVGSTRRRHSDQHAASLSSGRRSLSDGSKPSERRTLSSSKAHSLRRDASSSSSSSSSSLLRRRSSTQDSLLTRRSSAREQQTGGSAGGGSSITGSRMETQALMTSSVTSSPPVPPSSAMSSVTSVSSLQLSPNHAGEVSASVPVTATTSTHQGLCKGPALRRHRTTSMNLSSVASSDGALLESPPARTSSADWALPSASVATASTLSSSSPLSTSHLSRVSEHVAPHDCTTPPITSSTSNDDITVSHHDVMMSASQPVASVGTRSHSTSAIDTMLSASQAPAAATGSHQEDKEAREGRKTTAEQRRQLRVKRSERHKQQLQLVVEHVVMKHGVQRSDRLFQNCANRLFKVSKIFLEDLTTSHNLIAEMKKVAKNNVKQVVQSEFKNAKRSLSVS
ncbi:uncharacterized protein LOC135812236 isoform X2 [Sycon ciliatum]|uniref:uncharacterized protein LOC135812236 isoform X2 n=1 Tax=Sycon ciliatum TaxID=27933 RepID=UPI0031F62C94